MTFAFAVCLLVVSFIGLIYTYRVTSSEVARIYRSYQVSRLCRWNLNHPVRVERRTRG